MCSVKARSEFVPSLHLFTDKKKKQVKFCDIEYIKQFHTNVDKYVNGYSKQQNLQSLKGLTDLVQNVSSHAGTRLILFNALKADSHCPELILETAWELTKRNLGRILIVDCDFRTDALTKNYRLKKSPGIADYLTNELMNVEQIVKKTNIENVFLVQSGKLPKDKINLLLTEKFSYLINQFKADFDFIIFNSSPYLEHIDTFLLSKIIRPIFVQVTLDECKPNQLSGIQSELSILNLPYVTFKA